MWKRTYTWTCGCNDRPWRCRNRRRYHNHVLRECSVHRRILDAICENRNQCSERSHYNDIIMSAVASQITGVSSVYPIVCSGADQRKHQSSTSLAFVRGIYWWPVNSPHKRPVTRKMFPFDDVTISWSNAKELIKCGARQTNFHDTNSTQCPFHNVGSNWHSTTHNLMLRVVNEVLLKTVSSKTWFSLRFRVSYLFVIFEVADVFITIYTDITL